MSSAADKLRGAAATAKLKAAVDTPNERPITLPSPVTALKSPSSRGARQKQPKRRKNKFKNAALATAKLKVAAAADIPNEIQSSSAQNPNPSSPSPNSQSVSPQSSSSNALQSAVAALKSPSSTSVDQKLLKTASGKNKFKSAALALKITGATTPWGDYAFLTAEDLVVLSLSNEKLKRHLRARNELASHRDVIKSLASR